MDGFFNGILLRLQDAHDTNRPLPHLLSRRQIRASGPESLTLDSQLGAYKMASRILCQREALLARPLCIGHHILQRPGLILVSLHPQIVHPRCSFRKHIAHARHTAHAASLERGKQEIRGPAVHGELCGREARRQADCLSDISACQFHGDNVGMLCQRSENIGIQVDARCHGREVVDDNGQRACVGDVSVEAQQCLFGHGFSPETRRQQQSKRGAGFAGVLRQLDSFVCALPAYTCDQGIIRTPEIGDCTAGGMQDSHFFRA